jgi:hypothetical protein
VKIFKKGDLLVTSAGSVVEDSQVAEKDLIMPLGLQPICEKNFIFEMLVSLHLDEQTHHAVPLKVPEPLVRLFPGRKLLTKADGEAIQRWNADAPVIDNVERLRQRARTSAEDGVAAYQEFWGGISKDERKALAGEHEDNKATAQRVDAAVTMAGAEEAIA